MKNLEIERKYLVHKCDLPKDYKKYPHQKITQGFMYLKPCLRVRKIGNRYFFTMKSMPPEAFRKKIRDDLVRAEYEVEITKKVYNDLLKLCKGYTLVKTRYRIPYKKHIIELDVFENDFKGLIYAEVEFDSVKSARNFIPPSWFYKDVTGIDKYKNNLLSICKNIKSLLKY